MALQVSSTAFTDGTRIPDQYTCVGANVSPPLEWSGSPEGTRSFVLVCDDPDAPAPRGHGTHHYRFRLLALDISSLPVGRRPKCAKAEGAARRHVDVVAEAVLIGTFSL